MYKLSKPYSPFTEVDELKEEDMPMVF